MIYLTITKNYERVHVKKRIVKVQSPIALLNDVVQIFIQYYICNRLELHVDTS